MYSAVQDFSGKALHEIWQNALPVSLANRTGFIFSQIILNSCLNSFMVFCLKNYLKGCQFINGQGFHQNSLCWINKRTWKKFKLITPNYKNRITPIFTLKSTVTNWTRIFQYGESWYSTSTCLPQFSKRTLKKKFKIWAIITSHRLQKKTNKLSALNYHDLLCFEQLLFTNIPRWGESNCPPLK